jgi:hypothetical protein
LNLDKSIINLSKRIDRLDSFYDDSNDSNHWRGKVIIPLNDWIQLRETSYALEYFPDDFDRSHTFLTESELKNSDEQTKKWYSDYLDLMKHKRNLNYGKSKHINKSMRLAQGILMIGTLAQPVIHMMTVSMATHTTLDMATATAAVIPVTEHS